MSLTRRWLKVPPQAKLKIMAVCAPLCQHHCQTVEIDTHWEIRYNKCESFLLGCCKLSNMCQKAASTDRAILFTRVCFSARWAIFTPASTQWSIQNHTSYSFPYKSWSVKTISLGFIGGFPICRVQEFKMNRFYGYVWLSENITLLEHMAKFGTHYKVTNTVLQDKWEGRLNSPIRQHLVNSLSSCYSSQLAPRRQLHLTFPAQLSSNGTSVSFMQQGLREIPPSFIGIITELPSCFSIN